MNSLTILFMMTALVSANLVWCSEKLFFVWGLPQGKKTLFWILLEWLCWYGVMAAFAWFAERMRMGQVASQGWEFYTVTLSLFAVLAFPGFVVNKLWRR